jgi:hypothetical protein
VSRLDCSGHLVGHVLDLLMMVSLPGKESTEAEWRALYERAGLRVVSITVVNARSGESLVEGAAA